MAYPYDPEDPNSLRSEVEEDDEMFSRRERHDAPRATLVGEFVRKAIEGTLGQARTTGTMSKEALLFLLQQGDRGKRELVRLAAKELGDFLRQLDVSSEAVKVLTRIQVDFSASLKFRRNPEGDLELEVAPDSGLSVSDTPAEGHGGEVPPPGEASATRVEPSIERNAGKPV